MAAQVPAAGAAAAAAGAGAQPPAVQFQQQQLPDPLDKVRQVLTTCGVRTPQAADQFIDIHDITSITDFKIMKPSNAATMIKAYNDRYNRDSEIENLAASLRRSLQAS